MDYSNVLYDFNTADDFLDSISGAVLSLSPSSFSGDEISSYPNFPVPPLNDFPVNEDFTNPNIGPNEDLINQPYALDPPVKAEELLSVSLATYSNGTPTSQPALSSTHTSPGEEIKEKLVKPSKVTKPQKKDKTSHNMIERKYRTNINTKILELRDAVPSLRIAAGSGGNITVADLEGLAPASKLNKASVLTKATEYIKHLEQKNEILRKQNLQLQNLIQELSMRQPQQPNYGFGFSPHADSFNTTPVPQNFQHPPPAAAAPPQMAVPPPAQGPNRYLLGGMAAVMGTSFLSDNNDFQGLGALPFADLLPRTLTHPLQLTVQLFALVRVGLFVAAIATLLYPTIEAWVNKSEKQQPQSTLSSWVLVTLGLRLPNVLSDEDKHQIVLRLSGKAPLSVSQLASDYLKLSQSEATFETVLLNLVVGLLLITKYPLLNHVIGINMSLRGNLLVNLQYSGDNETLKRLSEFIKVDGVSFLASSQLGQRLLNLAQGVPVNTGLADGQNSLKYVEFIKDDYFETLLSWRVIEVVHELNVLYLQTLVSKTLTSENREKKMAQIIKDTEAVAKVVEAHDGALSTYFQMFHSVVDPLVAPSQIVRAEQEIRRQLDAFTVLVKGQQLTDTEWSDEEVAEEKSTTTTVAPLSRKLIELLNLITEEQYIVMCATLVLHHDGQERSQLLQRLQLKEDTTLSLLLFTALVRVIHDVHEENEVIDQLLGKTRLWINDESKQYYLSAKFRGDLSDVIVSRGLQQDSDQE